MLVSEGDRSQGRALCRGETGTNLGFPGRPLAARQGTDAQGEGRSRVPGRRQQALMGARWPWRQTGQCRGGEGKGLGLECILKLEPGRFAGRLDV